MANINDFKGQWFELWCECRESVLDCMVSNLKADLDCGYNWFGKSISSQRDMIAVYQTEYQSTLDMFKGMDEKAVDRWCFYDMKKRGDID